MKESVAKPCRYLSLAVAEDLSRICLLSQIKMSRSKGFLDKECFQGVGSTRRFLVP